MRCIITGLALLAALAFAAPALADEHQEASGAAKEAVTQPAELPPVGSQPPKTEEGEKATPPTSPADPAPAEEAGGEAGAEN